MSKAKRRRGGSVKVQSRNGGLLPDIAVQGDPTAEDVAAVLHELTLDGGDGDWESLNAEIPAIVSCLHRLIEEGRAAEAFAIGWAVAVRAAEVAHMVAMRWSDRMSQGTTFRKKAEAMAAQRRESGMDVPAMNMRRLLPIYDALREQGLSHSAAAERVAAEHEWWQDSMGKKRRSITGRRLKDHFKVALELRAIERGDSE